VAEFSKVVSKGTATYIGPLDWPKARLEAPFRRNVGAGEFCVCLPFRSANGRVPKCGELHLAKSAAATRETLHAIGHIIRAGMVYPAWPLSLRLFERGGPLPHRGGEGVAALYPRLTCGPLLTSPFPYGIMVVALHYQHQATRRRHQLH